jgi:hypothetical protein
MGFGFNEAARLTIEALKDGRFQHEPRSLASGKNLLATGDVSADDVVRLIRRCRGDQYEASPHHVDPSLEVNIFKPFAGGVRWYIKSYLVESDEFTAFFISVHESDYQ